MIGPIIRFIQKIFPKAFRVKPKRTWRNQEKFRPQLEVLVTLLTEQFGEKVMYVYGPKGLSVVIKTEIEIIARLTVHQKGSLRRSTFVRLRTDKPMLTAWFQLAFVGMKVTVAPLEKELLLR